jgi:hypothetical protein
MGAQPESFSTPNPQEMLPIGTARGRIFMGSLGDLRYKAICLLGTS